MICGCEILAPVSGLIPGTRERGGSDNLESIEDDR